MYHRYWIHRYSTPLGSDDNADDMIDIRTPLGPDENGAYVVTDILPQGVGWHAFLPVFDSHGANI